MLPRKQRILLTIMIPVIIVILIAIVLMVLFLTTDFMKPKEELFKKYFMQNFSTLSEITNVDDFNRYDNVLKTNNYESNTNITISSSEDSNKKVTFDITGITDNTNDRDYKTIKISDNQNDLMKLEYLKNNDVYGLKFENFKQYISIQNKNLKQLAQKIGMPDEIIEYIPNSIDTDSNIFENFEFTEEEKMQLLSKYNEIVFRNISGDKYSKSKNSLITVNNNSINTNAYKLTIAKEEYNNIIINVLEEIKQDEIILSKFQYQSIDMKKQIVEAIDEYIKTIKDSNISTENISITLYVYKGDLVRTLLETEESRMVIDRISNENTQKLSCDITRISETEQSSKIEISKQTINGEKQIDIVTENVDGENNTSTNITKSNQMVDNTINENLYMSQENGNSSFEITSKKVINLKEINSIEELNESNNVNLNNLEPERIEQIMSIVGEKVSPSITQVGMSIGNIVSMGILENLNNEDIFSGENENTLTQMQIQRFNTQYEVYEGSEVKDSDVKIMLKAISNNIKDIEVIDNNTLKIYVEKKHNGDTGLSEKISKAIKDDNTYKIELSYNNDTKLVDYITLIRNVEEE